MGQGHRRRGGPARRLALLRTLAAASPAPPLPSPRIPPALAAAAVVATAIAPLPGGRLVGSAPLGVVGVLARLPGDALPQVVARPPAARRVARAGLFRAGALAIDAAVVGGAYIAVVAGGAVRGRLIVALPGVRVAGPGRAALAAGLADDGVAGNADAGLAGVVARAGVAVVARRAVLGRGIGALPGVRIAASGAVALVARCADHGVATDAGAVPAFVAPGAGIAVVARFAVVVRPVVWVAGCVSDQACLLGI